MGSVHYHCLNHEFSRLYGKAYITATGLVYLQQIRYTKAHTTRRIPSLRRSEMSIELLCPRYPRSSGAQYIHSNRVNLTTLCNYNQGSEYVHNSNNMPTKVICVAERDCFVIWF